MRGEAAVDGAFLKGKPPGYRRLVLALVLSILQDMDE